MFSSVQSKFSGNIIKEYQRDKGAHGAQASRPAARRADADGSVNDACVCQRSSPPFLDATLGRNVVSPAPTREKGEEGLCLRKALCLGFKGDALTASRGGKECFSVRSLAK